MRSHSSSGMRRLSRRMTLRVIWGTALPGISRPAAQSTVPAVNTVPAVLFGRLSANGDTLSGEYRWAFGQPPDTVAFVRY